MRARVTALLVFVCLISALVIAQQRGILVITVVDVNGAIRQGRDGHDRRSRTTQVPQQREGRVHVRRSAAWTIPS